MLKLYYWNGTLWQFEEGEQPADAAEVIEVVPVVPVVPEGPQGDPAGPKGEPGIILECSDATEPAPDEVPADLEPKAKAETPANKGRKAANK